jgi:hypothetical protein
MKLDLWLSKLKGRKICMLPVLPARPEERNSDTNFSADMLPEIEAHLLSLKEAFSRSISDIASSLFTLVKCPFIFDVAGVPETAQEKFIETISDTGVKSVFSSFPEI